MIRIDEIYYNTFLPKVQANPNASLHWFDPFGSVNYEDLCNLPVRHLSYRRARRFICWDQEPVQPQLIDQVMPRFIQEFSGQYHMITSEYSSNTVAAVANTYGLHTHYYFFHGWAALDWFRGYHRSYLMPAPEYRHIQHTFISPNRIVAGQRQHRLILLYHMIRLNLLEGNLVSFPAVCPAEHMPVSEAIKPLVQDLPDIEAQYHRTLATLPWAFDGEAAAPNSSCRLDLFDECSRSLLYVVTETVASGQRQHLTEKTFKPICLRMPFVIVGTAGCLAYLRSYGFKTFSDFWDESYDEETDDLARVEKIAHVLKDLDSLSALEKHRLYTACYSVIEHNYQHFYSGGFEQRLWAELTTMMQVFNV